MTERQQRALRGIVAAALAVFVAALFHVAGGGAAPGALGVAVSLALATPASVLLAGRRPRLWRLGSAVTLSQLAFHAFFSLGQPSAVRFAGDTGMAGMPGMSVHVLSASGGASAGASAGASVDFAAPAMYAGHALAALVTIAAIHRGELVLRRMLELAARFLVRAVRLVHSRPLPRVRTLTEASAPAARPLLFLTGALRHRGPPPALALS